MNRIILIGNGFDVAHGMKTRYQDFLNDYWNNIWEKRSQMSGDVILEDDELVIKKGIAHYETKESAYTVLKSENQRLSAGLFIKNKFLEAISEKSHIQNWVDIENEYYELLKKSFGDRMDLTNFYSVKTLNRDFAVVKFLLAEYLKRVEEDPNPKQVKRSIYQIGEKIYAKFKWKDFCELAKDRKAKYEFQKIEILRKELSAGLIEERELNRYKDISKSAEVRDLLLNYNDTYNFDSIADATLLLNFNYTATDKEYIKPFTFRYFKFVQKYESAESIHIHGSLNEQDKNPIIFGYGDELDDTYKQIEKLNKNEYLDNIKSIKYFETDNYKKLLEFIEGDEYQVFIFGHSCGTSDRTLLNTLFEHDNCASIKPFYHKKEDGSDNYSDIVRNISRNFNNKVKMRDRVVNKTYCEPLVGLK